MCAETKPYWACYHVCLVQHKQTSGIQLIFRFFVDDMVKSVMDVPSPLIDANPSWIDFWEWGKPWNDGYVNPWAKGSNMAPFDQAVCC